jgi:hypothetical protein
LKASADANSEELQQDMVGIQKNIGSRPVKMCQDVSMISTGTFLFFFVDTMVAFFAESG